MSNFHVGQKVVCISEPIRRDFVTAPVVGGVYTVRGFNKDHRGDVGLLLVEIVNRRRFIRSMDDGVKREPSFFAHRFRPVVERKTDISIFKAMLNPQKTEVPA